MASHLADGGVVVARTSGDQISGRVGAAQPGGVVGASQVGGTVGARLAQPQANLWTPAQLGSDLALWLDVWDSPFDLRSDGGTDYVERWGDLSGNGRDATQGTASAQPKLKSKVVYDGQDDLLNAPPLLSKNIGFGFLGILRDESQEYRALTSATTESFTILRVFSSEIAVFRGGAQIGYSFSEWGEPKMVFFQSDVLTLTLWVDGKKVDSISSGSEPRSKDNPVRIGAARSGKRNFTASNNIVVTLQNQVVSDSQVERWFGWVAHKASRNGIDAPLQNLPSDHPYKDEPPKV